ncbi:MAG TPA: 50S ribosomal protein L22 [Chloroflexota bacterium]|nr:50S ribosomal protein L22 [Chloroflexota bacterium]
MQVRAQAKFVRMSPRKVQLVVEAIRGRPAMVALAELQFFPKAAAREVWKVVRSAVANAENNYGLNPSNLVVTTATADQGPPFPMRFRAKARGQAGPIRKRTTHITVVVDDEATPARKR